MSTTSLLVQSAPVLAQGALLTVKFALYSMFFGLIAAVVLALMGISQNRTLIAIARSYVSVMRGTRRCSYRSSSCITACRAWAFRSSRRPRA